MYWVSWISGNYTDEGCSDPPFKYWLTGQIERDIPDEEDGERKDDCTLCAIFDKPHCDESEEEIWEEIKTYFPDYRMRFIDEKPDGWNPNDRFE